MNSVRRLVTLLTLAALSLTLSVPDASAQSGAWTKKASLPTSGSAACVVNGKIYVVGGAGNYPGYNDMATNAMYDPATNTWTAKTPMNVARGFLSAAAVGDTIYAIGGGYPTSKDVVEAYDTKTDTWTTRAKMLSPRLGAQAVVLNGLIYNLGGNYSESNCEIYNPASNIWMPSKPIPNAGGVLSATVCDGFVYTFGGGFYGAQNAVVAYNPQTDTWKPKQSMPTARYAFRTYLVGGKIYAMGGAPTQNASTSIVEVYDPATDTWERLPDMPLPLAWFAGAVVNDKIYVIGGTSDWNTMKTDVWEFDPAFHTDVAAGNVSGVWKLQNSPYLINGQITIPNDSTLTIEPGVEVVFSGHYKLNVQGRLLALGTKADSIRFTAADKSAGWHGVRFINTPAANDTSKLLYCSFRYGKANTGDLRSLDRSGGAVMINGFDKVLISDCIFEYNMTSGDNGSTGGPGVCIFNGSPTVTRSTFRYNDGREGSAGAIKIDFASRALITENTIVHNASNFGAILCAFQADNQPTISRNLITDNSARIGGGGIIVYGSSRARIENNIILRNSGPNGGGLYIMSDARPVLVNNTIAFNQADNMGGGIACESNSDPILVNNILFGNLAAIGKQLSLADDACDPLVSYNDIEGGKEGFGGPGAGGSYTGIYEKNIAADPALAEASGGHYHLSASSRCLSAGIDSITLGGVRVRAPLVCFHGVPRPNPAGTRPDLGACESEYFSPAEEVNEHPDQLPTTFALAQNYPNPFNPTTTIRYSLPRRSHVILVVYNTVGQTVAELINGAVDAGSHEMLFDAGRLASGVYFYRLAAGDFRQTRAMLLVR